MLKRFFGGLKENSKSTTQLGYLLLIRRVPAITTGWMFLLNLGKIMGRYSLPTDPTGELNAGNLRDPSFRPDFTTAVQDGVKPVGSFKVWGEVKPP